MSNMSLSPETNIAMPSDSTVNADVEQLIRDEEVGPTPTPYQGTVVPVRSPWYVRVFAWTAKVALGFLGILISLIVIKRWIVHGITIAKKAMVSNMKDLYSLLDYLSPSETEEIKIEKVEEIKGVFVRNLDKLFQQTFFVYFFSMTALDWIILFFGGMVTITGTYLAVKLLTGSGKRVIQRMRGVRLESVREGSVFRKGSQPDCQLSVAFPGTFSDEHSGFGIRVEDYMVLPTHVLKQNGDLVTSVVLQGKKSRVLVPLCSLQESKAVDDVSYVYIDGKTWSMLGVSKAKLASRTTPSYATCFGKSGESSGRVQKTNCRWMISYSGSTLPGMSGAPYVDTGCVIGIHTGASGAYNIGVSSALLRAELSKICSTYVSEGTRPKQFSSQPTGRDEVFDDDTAYNRASTGNRKLWDDLSALKSLDSAYADDWLNPIEIDYNQKLNFDDEGAVGGYRPLNVQLPQGGIRLSQHSPDGNEVTYAPAGYVDFVKNLHDIAIVERVAELEAQVNRLTKMLTPQPPKGQFPCSHCGVISKTDVRLRNHVENSHPIPSTSRAEPVQLSTAPPAPMARESAFASDFKSDVTQAPFLGRQNRPRNQTTSRNNRNPMNSRENLNSSAVRNPSPSLEASLSAMTASQQSTERVLRELLAVMVGRASATMRN
uniref:Uncharacterized protein n=1 Tax=Tama virus TaxID=2170592 RepID=A0A2S0S4Q0_9VIRU|nr:hypothetical protein [Tama virus]